MNKWQRVLNEWHNCGHFGLTIQQLSYITGIPGRRLLAALKKNGRVGWKICDNICAPVVKWFQPEYGSNLGFNHSKTKTLAEAMLKLYPTPKYKGMKNWVGLTDGDVGLCGKLTKLRKAAGWSE